MQAQPSLEAQVADRADEIAYLNHDLDDGLRSGLLSLEQLEDVALWSETRRKVEHRMPGSPERVLRAQTIVALINRLVTELSEASAAAAERLGVTSPQGVCTAPERVVVLPAGLEEARARLKDFLSENLYHHPHVVEMTQRAEHVLADLFGIYRNDPSLLPPRVVARLPEDGEARSVADYVAGMTDRYALEEHRRFFADGPD